MKTFGERLRELREERRISQIEFGQRFNLNQSTIANYELDRRQPNHTTLDKFANYFGVTIDYLMGRSDVKNPTSVPLNLIPLGRRILLPVIGTVRAGINGLAYDDPRGEELVDVDSINGAKYFWLVVKGDSMVGDLIGDGDLALVREQPDIENGEIAVVIVNGEEGTIKRVYKDESSIVLQSSNPAYPPRIFSGVSMESVRIVGKVKELKRKL